MFKKRFATRNPSCRNMGKWPTKFRIIENIKLLIRRCCTYQSYEPFLQFCDMGLSSKIDWLMPTKKGGSGLVFSSDSLKEFLGSSSKAGVSKKVVEEFFYKKSDCICKTTWRKPLSVIFVIVNMGTYQENCSLFSDCAANSLNKILREPKF